MVQKLKSKSAAGGRVSSKFVRALQRRGSSKEKSNKAPALRVKPQQCDKRPERIKLGDHDVGVCESRSGSFNAYIMFEGFSIDTQAIASSEIAWANRRAMERVNRHVCLWLAEERPADEAVTDLEFVGFVRGLLAEVRATWPNLVDWRYHSEIKKTKGKPAVRVKTVGCIAEALRGWRALRQNLNLADMFNMSACTDLLRDEAEVLAKQIMSGLDHDAYPTDDNALQVLRAWGFSRNKNRPNVLPDDREWVNSDTLGLVLPQVSVNGVCRPVISASTRKHETVFRLLHRWVHGRLPGYCGDKLPPCTSMSLNRGYAARLHRDGRNEGPSVGISVGKFEGGRLKYWPTDNGRIELKDLQLRPHIVLDTKMAPQVFDGCLGHEVEPFTGERFSAVLFTCPRRHKVSKATRMTMGSQLGIRIPTDAELRHMRTFLPGNDGLEPKQPAAVPAKPAQLQCQNGHVLVHRAQHDGWICDGCGDNVYSSADKANSYASTADSASFGSIMVCSLCNWGLCGKCSESRSSCQHDGQPLKKNKKALKQKDRNSKRQGSTLVKCQVSKAKKHAFRKKQKPVQAQQQSKQKPVDEKKSKQAHSGSKQKTASETNWAIAARLAGEIHSTDRDKKLAAKRIFGRLRGGLSVDEAIERERQHGLSHDAAACASQSVRTPIGEADCSEDEKPLVQASSATGRSDDECPLLVN